MIIKQPLRPQNFQDYVGQDKIITTLKKFILTATKQDNSLSHILLSGSPGTGKTSLAKLIAQKLKVKFKSINGLAVNKLPDIISILSLIERKQILFIDEIHALNPKIQEFLQTVMEDFQMSLILGENLNSRIVRMKVPIFTLIGATTNAGEIGNPFRERFIINYEYDEYSLEQIILIIRKYCERMQLLIENSAIEEIAVNSRNNPRKAINNLINIANLTFSEKSTKMITKKTVKSCLTKLDIYDLGLSKNDLIFLKLLFDSKNHRYSYVGLKAIAIQLSISEKSIENVYEPYLINKKLIRKTTQGRSITLKGESILKKTGFIA